MWLMADVQAIYSGLSAAPMELDTDGFHDRIHQKILHLPQEGNGSRPTFTLLEKHKYDKIKQRAKVAYQHYLIDDSIYDINPLPRPTSVPKDGECIDIDD